MLLAAIHTNNDISTGSTQAAARSHCLSIDRASVNGNEGFTVSGLIHNFSGWFPAAGINGRHPSIIFAAAGRRWAMDINEDGSRIEMLSGHALTASMWESTWGSGPRAVKQCAPREVQFCDEHPSWLLKWKTGEVDRMLHPRLLTVGGGMEGSLHVNITLTFRDVE